MANGVFYPMCNSVLNTAAKDMPTKCFLQKSGSSVGVVMRCSTSQAQLARASPSASSVCQRSEHHFKPSCIAEATRSYTGSLHICSLHRFQENRKHSRRDVVPDASPWVEYPVADDEEASGSEQGDEEESRAQGEVDDWVMEAVQEKMKKKALEPGL
eukprot:4145996-Pyramimonas_sp.AAC.1